MPRRFVPLFVAGAGADVALRKTDNLLAPIARTACSTAQNLVLLCLIKMNEFELIARLDKIAADKPKRRGRRGR